MTTNTEKTFIVIADEKVIIIGTKAEIVNQLSYYCLEAGNNLKYSAYPGMLEIKGHSYSSEYTLEEIMKDVTFFLFRKIVESGKYRVFSANEIS